MPLIASPTEHHTESPVRLDSLIQLFNDKWVQTIGYQALKQDTTKPPMQTSHSQKQPPTLSDATPIQANSQNYKQEQEKKHEKHKRFTKITLPDTGHNSKIASPTAFPAASGYFRNPNCGFLLQSLSD